jgi:hypothetical protein
MSATLPDVLNTPDALGMRRALEAGDDSALPMLAELLEDRGDRRHFGVRDLIRRGYRPEILRLRGGICWGWQCGNGHACSVSARLAGKLDRTGHVTRWGDWRYCEGRDLAVLLLAEALS